MHRQWPEYLQGHEKIAWVQYAGLPNDTYHERAKKYMPNGTCGVVIFGVKGGRAAAEKFMAGLKLASIATHVADAKTCVLHPASSTHRQMSDAELAGGQAFPLIWCVFPLELKILQIFWQI